MFKRLVSGALVAMTFQVQAQSVLLSGVEASRDNAYAYLGMVTPLPGNALGKGWVQRYWLDHVAYSYDKTSAVAVDAKVDGFEAALGYQGSDPSGWWAAYAGARYAHTRFSPDDPDNDDRGTRLRAKLQLEGETALSPAWKINAIASHVVGADNYWARLRLQTRLTSGLDVGPEVIMQGARNYSAYRLGAYVGNIGLGKRAALTLKAGFAKPDNDSAAPYAGAELYLPF